MLRRLISLQYFSFVFVLGVCNCFINKSQFNVFKTNNNTYVFVRHGGHVQKIPDLETVASLGFDPYSVQVISDDVLTIMKQGVDVPSLIHASKTEDEMMRVKIDKILTFDPAPYWTESNYLPGHTKEIGAYNPAIARINKNKILMSWRSGDINSVLQFGWYDLKKHTVTEDSTMEITNTIQHTGKFASMEDGRVIAVNNHTIAVIYGGKFAKFDQHYNGIKEDIMMIAYGTLSGGGSSDSHGDSGSRGDNSISNCNSIGNSNSNSTIDFSKAHGRSSSAMWMKYPDSQKNWTPFIHNGKVLMFQSINPVHVVKATMHHEATSDSSFDHNNEMIAQVKTVAQAEKVTHLPWNGTEYGEHIKGGTPAILVRGVMLSILHTQAIFVRTWRTYFMGAITFCPHPPFNIHSMSSVPIVKKELYDGAWANRQCNYVLFPMGIVLDEDNEHVHVSLGYQDRQGYVIKLQLDGLFESMTVVGNCSAASASTSH